MTNLDYDILRALDESGQTGLPNGASAELRNYYPDLREDLNDRNFITDARSKYLIIIKMYLIFYHIPLTIESIVSAFLWGIKNLRTEGLENTPSNIKSIIAKVRHYLEPQADMLMIEAEKK